MKTMAAVTMAALLLGGVAEAKKKPTQLQGVLNLNNATKSQLTLLPGIGEKAAEKIVTLRQKAPFQKVEDLLKVKGLGKKRFEKLKPYLTVNGPTTLSVVKEGGAGKGQARSAPPRR